jgi:hypothetical protein
MRCWISLSLLLLATASVSVAQQPAASASPSPDASKAVAAASPAASPADDNDSALEFPVPPGAPVTDIRLPQFGPDGKLKTFFFAKKATKIDDDHIAMEGLSINAYNTDGTKIDVDMPKSLLNLKTRLLTGDSRVFINRGDFQIEGDAVEFYTKTRFAKIIGNVRMTIYNSEKLTQ